MLFRLSALTLIVFSSVALSEEAVIPSWLSFDEASVGIRPVIEKDSSGVTTARDWQYQDVLGGKIFVDPSHRLSFNFLAGSGDAFPGGWSNTGAGSAPASGKFYLKQLYADAVFVPGLEVQWGGLGMERGVSTAISSYSGDGFMTGERFYVRSHALYFDKVALTFGYLGSIDRPNVWDRANTLWMNNYQQYLLEKKLSDRLTASTDYSVLAGTRTFRQAIRVNVPEWKAIDTLQFDMYERTNHTAAAGGHIGASKKINRALDLAGGYAAIDRNYGDLNDDAFFHGRRAYVAATVHLGAGFAVSPMFDHAIGNNYPLPNMSHFHVAFTYEIAKLLPERR